MESFEDVKKKHWSCNIVKKYKHLFADRFWGIECGSGWQKPITKLLESFEWNRINNTHIDNPDYDPDKEMEEGNYPCIPNPNPEGNKIQIFQIKEKFGSLRVYYNYDNPKLERGLLTAEGACIRECNLRCEKCGILNENGVLSIGGWLTCLCDECLEKRNETETI